MLDPSGDELAAAGTLEGEIAAGRAATRASATTRSSSRDGETRTVAELGDAWKAEHSHRAQAARALGQLLAER